MTVPTERRASWTVGTRERLVKALPPEQALPDSQPAYVASWIYVVQTNFDSQWISTQAKDGINATGAGAFWNVLNLGQMLLWHIMLLPLGVGIIVALHVILVRLRGVVPPIGIGSDGEPTSDRKAMR
jgi:quinol-cytochrome oxidoreductase complex cytochrome b subunit